MQNLIYITSLSRWKTLTFYLLTSDEFNEYLTVVKSLVRDFSLWFVKTSTSDQTSVDLLSFQTLVTSTSISQSSHLINFISCNLNSYLILLGPSQYLFRKADAIIKISSFLFLLFLHFRHLILGWICCSKSLLDFCFCWGLLDTFYEIVF